MDKYHYDDFATLFFHQQGVDAGTESNQEQIMFTSTQVFETIIVCTKLHNSCYGQQFFYLQSYFTLVLLHKIIRVNLLI